MPPPCDHAASVWLTAPELLWAATKGDMFGPDVVPMAARFPCPPGVLRADPELEGVLTDVAVKRLRCFTPGALVANLPGSPHRLHGVRLAECLGFITPFLEVARLETSASL